MFIVMTMIIVVVASLRLGARSLSMTTITTKQNNKNIIRLQKVTKDYVVITKSIKFDAFP